MRVWFFKERWLSSNGWKAAHYAVTAQGCHMTCGINFPDAIYMAHDLIACLKDEDEKFYDEPFEYLNDGIFDTDSRNLFIGVLDLDVELFPNGGWCRAGDKPPKIFCHMRWKMLRRAFQLSYKKSFGEGTNS